MLPFKALINLFADWCSNYMILKKGQHVDLNYHIGRPAQSCIVTGIQYLSKARID